MPSKKFNMDNGYQGKNCVFSDLQNVLTVKYTLVSELFLCKNVANHFPLMSKSRFTNKYKEKTHMCPLGCASDAH